MSLDHMNYKGEFVYIEELNAIHGIERVKDLFLPLMDEYTNGEKFSIESATVAGDIKYS